MEINPKYKNDKNPETKEDFFVNKEESLKFTKKGTKKIQDIKNKKYLCFTKELFKEDNNGLWKTEGIKLLGLIPQNISEEELTNKLSQFAFLTKRDIDCIIKDKYRELYFVKNRKQCYVYYSLEQVSTL